MITLAAAPPANRYDTIRNLFQNADVFLCSGNSPIDSFIKSGTASDFSHCGLLFWWGNRLMAMESVLEHGVRTIPFSRYFTDHENSGQPFNGRVIVGRYTNNVLTKAPLNIDSKAVKSAATEKMGDDYNKQEIIDIMARLTLALGSYTPQTGALICSEYVALALQAGGYRVPAAPGGYWYPGSLAIDANLVPIWEVTP